MIEALKAEFEMYRAQIDVARAAMAEKSQGLIEAVIHESLQSAPQISSFFWTQYTPHFNDGEPCLFSVHELQYVLKGEACDEYEGSYLYNSDDYNRALQALQDVKLYHSDPQAYIAHYKQAYYERTNREYTHRVYPPYPNSIESAQQHVDEIAAQLARYSDDDRQRIHAAYSDVAGILALIPDDIMQNTYGDGVRVCVSASGTEIDTYYHD